MGALLDILNRVAERHCVNVPTDEINEMNEKAARPAPVNSFNSFFSYPKGGKFDPAALSGANLVAPSSWFERFVPPPKGEPGFDLPCIARRGRVKRLEGAVVIHFCVECGAWGTYGYGVNLRANQLGRWYCAAHRPQGCAP